ncbi:Mrp/NBP35 family ATP-binding protein [Lachnoclostridium sp. Marseille-P6806]|uniref:Mrp/NBP35 family ATP-binding protein n=1 Tax=Lachnoclostridium sp. Marseille-P6806 TaxID=2364793 RepID=UPI0010318947|nr:Mrp/NBP35 family ATP-binding protein [Lachnoclostridium sp. Marseille-P6806]
MSENCNHDCNSCGENCASRDPKSFIKPQNKGSNVKKLITVVSGKGGVGKSLVTGLAAVESRRSGYSTAILDADITGPSIPKMFGLGWQDVSGTEDSLLPAVTKTGIKVMSMNLLMENPDQPVIWRSPVITGALTQFWTDVAWGDVDYMFVDMPPGTGDVPLTVYQSLPVDGIVIVTTPQDLVGMIVDKAVGMANTMQKPILGLVENMSYVKCPDCGREIRVFGDSHAEELAAKHGFPVIGRIALDPALTAACDAGEIEYYDGEYLTELKTILESL